MGLISTLKQRITRGRADRDAVFAVYNDLVARARAEELYRKFGIPDTLDGRFEAIVLHLALFLVATRETLEQAGKAEMGRDLTLVFMKDMDRSLREIGVGDLSVGKQVKKMASAHHGRLKAYEEALTGKDTLTELTKALRRNLYRGQDIPKTKVSALADYSFALYKNFRGMDLSDILAAGKERTAS